MIEDIEISKLLAVVLSLSIAVIGHEIMHGWVAYRYGDDLAKSQGRLSVNPIVHIDLVGTILVPLALFFMHAPFIIGWAKPVPINSTVVIRNGGHKAMLAVDLAGITYNLLLAVLFSALYPIAGMFDGEIGIFLHQFFFYGVVLNVVLAIFNLWPIPPLDGGHALKQIALMNKWNSLANFMDTIAPYGMLIIVAIISTPIKNYLFEPARWLWKILLP